MAEVCYWSMEGRGGSKLANHNLFQSNACIFPQWCNIYNDYHDYLLVATAECFILCIKWQSFNLTRYM